MLQSGPQFSVSICMLLYWFRFPSVHLIQQQRITMHYSASQCITVHHSASCASQCITVHLVHGRLVIHKAEQSPRKRRALESSETPPLPWQHLFSLKTKTNSVIETSSLISYDVDRGNGNENEPLEKAEFCMAISLPHHNEILIEQFFVCANHTSASILFWLGWV